jgi:hypothetical protein
LQTKAARKILRAAFFAIPLPKVFTRAQQVIE